MINRIIGTSADDTLNGVPGDDLILGRNGADSLFAITIGDDIDTVGLDTLRGGNGPDTLSGRDGDQVLDGGNGPDLIFFGAGRDTVLPGTGADTLRWIDVRSDVFDRNIDIVNGGGGSDLLQVPLASIASSFVGERPASVSMTQDAKGRNVIKVDGDTLLRYSNIEVLDLDVPLGADLTQFDGTRADERIEVRTGAHSANLKGGDDVLDIVLDSVPDQIDMGSGTDTVRLSFFSSTLDRVVDLQAGTFAVGDSVTEIQNAEVFEILGSGLTNDTLIGSDGDDTLTGGVALTVFVADKVTMRSSLAL